MHDGLLLMELLVGARQHNTSRVQPGDDPSSTGNAVYQRSLGTHSGEGQWRGEGEQFFYH